MWLKLICSISSFGFILRLNLRDGYHSFKHLPNCCVILRFSNYYFLPKRYKSCGYCDAILPLSIMRSLLLPRDRETDRCLSWNRIMDKSAHYITVIIIVSDRSEDSVRVTKGLRDCLNWINSKTTEQIS